MVVMRSCMRTHVGTQCRLVTHSRWDAAQKCRHLGACLSKAENVVHEEQHVLAFIAEVFGNGQSGQSNTGIRAPGGSFIWP